MTNELRFQPSMPSITEDEAKVLFTYHLQMAACIFELLPEGFELPAGAFDDYSREAATNFLQNLEAAYTIEDEELEDRIGC